MTGDSPACHRCSLADMHGLLRAAPLGERTQLKAASGEKATQCSLLARRIPRVEEPGVCSPWGRRVRPAERLLSLPFRGLGSWAQRQPVVQVGAAGLTRAPC